MGAKWRSSISWSVVGACAHCCLETSQASRLPTTSSSSSKKDDFPDLLWNPPKRGTAHDRQLDKNSLSQLKPLSQNDQLKISCIEGDLFNFNYNNTDIICTVWYQWFLLSFRQYQYSPLENTSNCSHTAKPLGESAARLGEFASNHFAVASLPDASQTETGSCQNSRNAFNH